MQKYAKYPIQHMVFMVEKMLNKKYYNNIFRYQERGQAVRKKKLYKSDKDKKICGVCGGIANYFDVDPTIIRLAWVIFTLAGGSGLLAYIIAAIIMPQDPGYIDM